MKSLGISSCITSNVAGGHNSLWLGGRVLGCGGKSRRRGPRSANTTEEACVRRRRNLSVSVPSCQLTRGASRTIPWTCQRLHIAHCGGQLTALQLFSRFSWAHLSLLGCLNPLAVGSLGPSVFLPPGRYNLPLSAGNYYSPSDRSPTLRPAVKAHTLTFSQNRAALFRPGASVCPPTASGPVPAEHLTGGPPVGSVPVEDPVLIEDDLT